MSRGSPLCNDVPRELLIDIYKPLSARDRRNLAQTCKSMHESTKEWVSVQSLLYDQRWYEDEWERLVRNQGLIRRAIDEGFLTEESGKWNVSFDAQRRAEPFILVKIHYSEEPNDTINDIAHFGPTKRKMMMSYVMSREYKQVDTRPTFVFFVKLIFSYEARCAGLTVPQKRCLQFCVEWIKEMRPWINDIFLFFDKFPTPQFPINNIHELYASGFVNDAMMEILRNEGKLKTMYTKILVGMSYCDRHDIPEEYYEDIYPALVEYLTDEDDCSLVFDWGNSIEMQIRSDLVYDNMSDWDEYFYS